MAVAVTLGSGGERPGKQEIADLGWKHSGELTFVEGMALRCGWNVVGRGGVAWRIDRINVRRCFRQWWHRASMKKRRWRSLHRLGAAFSLLRIAHSRRRHES